MTWEKIAYFDDIVATKLDAFTAPDDGTTLDASNARHGLLKKLIDDTTKFLRSDGGWQVPAGATQVKVKAETRDMTAASGNVSYTGYGFTPTQLLFFASGGATGSGSFGSSDASKLYVCLCTPSGAAVSFNKTNCIFLGELLGANQKAIVASYDAGVGFTLTWTKTGSPAAGTANILVVAFG